MPKKPRVHAVNSAMASRRSGTSWFAHASSARPTHSSERSSSLRANRSAVASTSLAPPASPRCGNDTYDPRGGDDRILDTGGSDTVTYGASPAGVVVELATGRARGWGSDSFESIEHLVGSSHDDDIVGDDRVNVLAGGGGDDRISGWGGNDTLLGGEGDDSLFGGTGRDVLDGGPGTDLSDGEASTDSCAIGDPSDVRVSCELAL